MKCISLLAALCSPVQIPAAPFSPHSLLGSWDGLTFSPFNILVSHKSALVDLGSDLLVFICTQASTHICTALGAASLPPQSPCPCPSLCPDLPGPCPGLVLHCSSPDTLFSSEPNEVHLQTLPPLSPTPLIHKNDFLLPPTSTW